MPDKGNDRRENRAERSFPDRVSRWSGLRAQMTFTTILVVLALVVLLLSLRLCIFLLLREPVRDLTVAMYIALVVPAWTPIIGTVIGLAATRSPVRRIQRLVLATTAVAHGDYDKRVLVSRRDEIGQLEHHFNRMAEQLAEGSAERQILVEQNARLAERTRIARDLHDSVKQQLFAVAMQIGVALSQVEAADLKVDVPAIWAPLREHLVEADTLISQAQQDLTELIHQWRPSALQQGFALALRAYAATWCQRYHVALDLQIEPAVDAVPLPAAVEEALWHIAREALANVVRHSRATEVSLQLMSTSEQVTLVIADNGCGFTPESNLPATGVGLHSMSERVAPLGGSVTVTSSLDMGTRITARCPLPSRARDVASSGLAGSEASDAVK
jgi:NarL family two-component system sensor histidine kinase LiaS